jgi:hypothetical protein
VEPGTEIDLFGLGNLLKRLLGPTADYLGETLQRWTKLGVENFERVLLNARRKLGDKADEEGQVPSRVLKGILEEAPFCSDPLAADYLGGVLASSRTGVSRDDRGASFVALIGRLSAYQVRTHFVFYQVAHQLLAGSDFNIGDGGIRRGLASIFMPRRVYDIAMEFTEGENPEAILGHAINGLLREELIDDDFWGFGTAEDLRTFLLAPAEGDCIVFVPSPLGMELYLVAQGIQDITESTFLDAAHTFGPEVGVPIPEGSMRVIDLRLRAAQGVTTTPPS